jgi:hypothetical protein
MNAIISLRKIANGYLVSKTGGHLNAVGGPAETFYPSADALRGDAAEIVNGALECAEKAEADLQRQMADMRRPEAQCAGAGIVPGRHQIGY